jgi:uncharacterized damage-inducible protein DinB
VLGESLLVEFDHEMAVTRRLLDRIPEAAFPWKPHEKSFSLGGLAMHLARLPHWGTQILERDAYEAETEAAPKPEPTSLADVLSAFDQNVAEVRRALTTRSDAELRATWTLKKGTHVVLSMPKVSALRRFLLHHVIHHRGQLTVYLRLQHVALPPIYGPSADERL